MFKTASSTRRTDSRSRLSRNGRLFWHPTSSGAPVWRIRWVEGVGRSPDPSRPYTSIPPREAALLGDAISRALLDQKRGDALRAEIPDAKFDEASIARLARSTIARKLNPTKYAYFAVPTYQTYSGGAIEPTLHDTYYLLPRADLPAAERMQAWRDLCTLDLPAGLARPKQCADLLFSSRRERGASTADVGMPDPEGDLGRTLERRPLPAGAGSKDTFETREERREYISQEVASDPSASPGRGDEFEFETSSGDDDSDADGIGDDEGGGAAGAGGQLEEDADLCRVLEESALVAKERIDQLQLTIVQGQAVRVNLYEGDALRPDTEAGRRFNKASADASSASMALNRVFYDCSTDEGAARKNLVFGAIAEHRATVNFVVASVLLQIEGTLVALSDQLRTQREVPRQEGWNYAIAGDVAAASESLRAAHTAVTKQHYKFLDLLNPYFQMLDAKFDPDLSKLNDLDIELYDIEDRVGEYLAAWYRVKDLAEFAAGLESKLGAAYGATADFFYNAVDLAVGAGPIVGAAAAVGRTVGRLARGTAALVRGAPEEIRLLAKQWAVKFKWRRYPWSRIRELARDILASGEQARWAEVRAAMKYEMMSGRVLRRLSPPLKYANAGKSADFIDNFGNVVEVIGGKLRGATAGFDVVKWKEALSKKLLSLTNSEIKSPRYFDTLVVEISKAEPRIVAATDEILTPWLRANPGLSKNIVVIRS